MAGKYLIEYVGTEGNVSICHRILGRIRFPDNPKYGGRRVVEVPTAEILDDMLKAGNPYGIRPARYEEPSDLLSLHEKRLVVDVLVDLGLVDSLIANSYLNGDAPPGMGPPLPAVKASEYALELAIEHNIDLTKITGTGAEGSILKADVEAAIEAKE